MVIDHCDTRFDHSEQKFINGNILIRYSGTTGSIIISNILPNLIVTESYESRAKEGTAPRTAHSSESNQMAGYKSVLCQPAGV